VAATAASRTVARGRRWAPGKGSGPGRSCCLALVSRLEIVPRAPTGPGDLGGGQAAEGPQGEATWALRPGRMQQMNTSRSRSSRTVSVVIRGGVDYPIHASASLSLPDRPGLAAPTWRWPAAWHQRAASPRIGRHTSRGQVSRARATASWTASSPGHAAGDADQGGQDPGPFLSGTAAASASPAATTGLRRQRSITGRTSTAPSRPPELAAVPPPRRGRRTPRG